MRKSKWFIPVLALAVVLLLSGAIWAATSWKPTNLTGSGTINVTTTSGGGGGNPTLTFQTGITVDGNPATAQSNPTFTVVTNNVVGTMHTLGLSGTVATPALADGDYGFKLQGSPAALTAYFAAKAGWPQNYKDQINSEINGTVPFFYLHAASGTYTLVDNFKKSLSLSPTTLTIDDDYPVGTYVYKGTLTGSNSATLDVTVTLIVTRASYTLSSQTLAFGTSNVATNGSIMAMATLTLANTGSLPITGIDLSNVVVPTTGSGWTLSVSEPSTPIPAGGTATLTFTLTGTAPSGAATIPLTGVSCTITPTGS